MRHTIVRAAPLLILGLVALSNAAAVADSGPRPLSLDDLGGVRFGWGDPPPAPEPPAPTAFERSIPTPAASALTATDLEAIAFRPGTGAVQPEQRAASAIAVAPAVPASRPATPSPTTPGQLIQLDLEALGGVGISRRD